MRIAFEIDANDLKQIQQITGQKKKSRAISEALADFLRLRERQAFIERALAGQTDYALTNDALEATCMRLADSLQTYFKYPPCLTARVAAAWPAFSA